MTKEIRRKKLKAGDITVIIEEKRNPIKSDKHEISTFGDKEKYANGQSPSSKLYVCDEYGKQKAGGYYTTYTYDSLLGGVELWIKYQETSSHIMQWRQKTNRPLSELKEKFEKLKRFIEEHQDELGDI